MAKEKKMVITREQLINERRQRMTFDAVFYCCQTIWWYILYAPEYCGWTEQMVDGYVQELQKTMNSFDYHTIDELIPHETILGDEIGIDLTKVQDRVSQRAKLNMLGRKMTKAETTHIGTTWWQIAQAVNRCTFFAAYTLRHNFKMSPGDTADCVNWFIEFTNNGFTHGMTESMIVKYFKEIEGCVVNV